MLKKLVHPTTGKTIKMGRKRPMPGHKKLHLSKYAITLPQFPDTCDYSAAASASLSNIYMNDQLGCCVIAGGMHVRGVTSGNSDGGTPVVFTDADVIEQYGAIGGYVNGDSSTDQGCDEVTAMNYWVNTGWPDGVKAAAWAAVPLTLVREALYLFENLVFGMELPDAWVSPFPSASGFTWDVAGAPDPSNGHCVVGVGYNPQGVVIDSWAMTGLITDAAIANYAQPSSSGELYVLLTDDIIAKATQKAPNGVDWASLQADIASFKS